MWHFVLISGISKKKQATSAAKCILIPKVYMYNPALITLKCWRTNYSCPDAVLLWSERQVQSSSSFMWNGVPQYASAPRALPKHTERKTNVA